jgi:hypothetical protein
MELWLMKKQKNSDGASVNSSIKDDLTEVNIAELVGKTSACTKKFDIQLQPSA